MRRNQDTQSTESTDEQQTATDSARSRRGFLKQAAATGILGMSGLAAATEVASATNTSEASNTAETQSVRAASYDNSITVWGVDDITDNQYVIRTTASEGNYGNIVAADGAEPDGNDYVGDNYVWGSVNGGGYDTYLFNGYVTTQKVVKGDVSFDVDG